MIRTIQNGPVLHAIIDRPETRNAINFGVMSQLEEILDQLESDDSILVFALRGSHGSFVSGGDLREFHQLTSEDEALDMGRRMLKILQRIEALDCWTVCLVNGAAYGGGWEMMLSFDMRVALPEMKFGFTQGRFYLPPGWGGLERLVRVVGQDNSKWLLSGQRVIDANRALALGLIQEVIESEEKFEEWIQPMTMNDREYIRHVKRFANGEGWNSAKSLADEANLSDSGSKFPEDEAELISFAKFWTHEEHTSRIEAFLKSRK